MSKRKLHVGCGPQLLRGWINVDNQPYNGIDAVVDVRNGIPYENLDFIFAEHFIEHGSRNITPANGSSRVKQCATASG